jgi:hypothetical protein
VYDRGHEPFQEEAIMKAFLFATALVAGTFSTTNAADDTPVTTQSGTPVVMTTTAGSTPVARRGLFSRMRGRMVTPMTTTTSAPTVVTPSTPATPATPMPSKVTSTEKTDKGVVQASGTTTTVESTTTSTMPVATTMTSTKPVRRMGFMSRMRMNRSSY